MRKVIDLRKIRLSLLSSPLSSCPPVRITSFTLAQENYWVLGQGRLNYILFRCLPYQDLSTQFYIRIDWRKMIIPVRCFSCGKVGTMDINLYLSFLSPYWYVSGTGGWRSMGTLFATTWRGYSGRVSFNSTTLLSLPRTVLIRFNLVMPWISWAADDIAVAEWSWPMLIWLRSSFG